MKDYVRRRITQVYTGVVRLTREQAADRRHSGAIRPLKPTYENGKTTWFSEDDLYEVTGCVTFKAGEPFAYDGDLPPEPDHPVRHSDLGPDSVNRGGRGSR